ncbi:putative transmembrane protein 62 [Paratrimastix pyriformis]|uniref:Transmembrane protein 62 n=1 Tax=Paratrimastix pyriformis TaxID=342808 RepID=A0ABQ8US61_9EUKA|nr:putative transmembrane protein 62 [Paratrimastix pyriformis]
MRVGHCIFPAWILVYVISWILLGVFPALILPRRMALSNATDSLPPMGNRADNVFWFLQISDLHLTSTEETNRTTDLEAFLTSVQNQIAPEVVLVTGDIIDSKTTELTSYLDTEAWKGYHDALVRSGALDPAHPCKYVLDVPGNHDGFGQPWNVDEPTLFMQYGSCGPLLSHGASVAATPLTHSHLVRKSYGTYGFLGVDTTSHPGPIMPINDDGNVLPQTMSEVQDFLGGGPYNGSVIFQHHPLTSMNLYTWNFYTTTVTPSGQVNALLDGHAHYPPGMYGHAGSTLELELGDWKTNRWYRLAAFDHDLFSFTDAQYAKDPVVILITNPKDARFLTAREPLHRLAQSTHVRALVFPTPAPGAPPVRIDQVTVTLDEQAPTLMRYASGTLGPMYVAPWAPAGLDAARGTHTVTVTAHYTRLVAGAPTETVTASQTFTLDGISVSGPFAWSRIELAVSSYAFWVSMLVSFGLYFLLFLLLLPKLALCHAHRQPRHRSAALAALGLAPTATWADLPPSQSLLCFCLTHPGGVDTPTTTGTATTANIAPEVLTTPRHHVVVSAPDMPPPPPPRAAAWRRFRALVARVLAWVRAALHPVDGAAFSWGAYLPDGYLRDGMSTQLFNPIYSLGFGGFLISVAHLTRLLMAIRLRGLNRAAQVDGGAVRVVPAGGEDGGKKPKGKEGPGVVVAELAGQEASGMGLFRPTRDTAFSPPACCCLGCGECSCGAWTQV